MQVFSTYYHILDRNYQRKLCKKLKKSLISGLFFHLKQNKSELKLKFNAESEFKYFWSKVQSLVQNAKKKSLSQTTTIYMINMANVK